MSEERNQRLGLSNVGSKASLPETNPTSKPPVSISIPLPRLTAPNQAIKPATASPAASPAPAPAPKLSPLTLSAPLPSASLEEDTGLELVGDEDDADDDQPTSMIALSELEAAMPAMGAQATEVEELDDALLLAPEEDEPPTAELRPEDLLEDDDQVFTSAQPMHAETKAQIDPEEVLDAEPTMLFDGHTALSESSPFDPTPMSADPIVAVGTPNQQSALDDYEEEGATIVFDSMSGKKVPAMDRGPSVTPQGLQINHHTPSPALIQPTPSQGLVDDFTAMRTELLQSPFERERVAPKLKVLSGPATQQEFFATGLRVTVGRGEQNNVVLGDSAMSRNHFEIVKNPDESFLIRDLDSANGTSLNGQPIREAALFHQDRIEVGKSVIQFNCQDAQPKPQRHMIVATAETFRGKQLDEKTSLAAFQLDQSTRFFTRVSIGAALICLPLIGVLVALSLRQPVASAQAPATSSAPTAATIPAHKAKATKLYFEGVDAMKLRDWSGAEAKFKRAKAMDESLQIDAQLELLKREALAQQSLERAKGLSEEGKLDELNGLVDAISAESVYYAEAQKLRRKQRLDNVDELYKQAQAQLTADALDDASQTITEILKLSPKHEGATKLQDALTTRRAELEKKQREEELAAAQASERGPDKSKQEVDPFGGSATPKSTINLSGGSGSLQDGLSLYKKGKFDQAIRALEGVSGADASKANKMISQIKQFKSGYSQGQSALKSKQWSKALSSLDKAYKADLRINGSYKQELAGMLAQAHGELGLGQLKSKKYKDARTELVAGQKLQAKHPKMVELSRALEDEATKLYIQAANKKKTDPDAARQICRQIMLMVPFSSTTNKKAQKLLTEL